MTRHWFVPIASTNVIPITPATETAARSMTIPDLDAAGWEERAGVDSAQVTENPLAANSLRFSVLGSGKTTP